METIQTLINIILFVINCCAITFICVINSKWIGRVEQKIDLLNKIYRCATNKIDAMYMHQLFSLRQIFVMTEEYKQAEHVQKMIELEFKLQKERNEKNVQNKNNG